MSNLTRLRRYLPLRLKDNLRHSRSVRHANALRLAAMSRFAPPVRAAVFACQGLGFSETDALNRQLSARIAAWIDQPPHPDFWQMVVRASHPRYGESLAREPSLTRSLLLKPPLGTTERGVLLMLFEYNWARLVLGLTDEDFQWLAQHYDFILSTSWSPTDYAVLAAMLSQTSQALWVQACNHEEMAKLRALHPRVTLMQTLGCDWIDPTPYRHADQGNRPIDFIMIANWGEFKRHWDFFNALRHLPSNLRVVLIGQPEGGRDAAYIQQLADDLDVPQPLEIHQSLPIERVTELQTQARVSLIFSRREGCCVAFVEGMFAGCAVGIRADAHVGPRSYVNGETGLCLRPGHLAEDLMRLHAMAERCRPAEWAEQHISCFRSHERLNLQMKEHSLQLGQPWSQDLAIPHWRPYPKHADPLQALALKPAYEELNQRLPQVFGGEFLSQATGPS